MIAALGILLALTLDGSALEKPALAVELRAPETVVVGDSIRLEFSLSNASSKPIDVRQVVLDDRSFAFDVRFDEGETAVFTQHAPLPPRVVVLKPAESLAAAIELPALAAGKFSVRAHYLGADEPIVSPERSIAIAPQGDLRELGLEITTSQGIIRAQWMRNEAPAACLHVARLALQGRYDAQPIDRVFHRYAVAFGATRLTQPESDASAATAGDSSRPPLPDGTTLTLDASAGKHQRGVLTLWRAGRPGESFSQPSRDGAGNGAFFALLTDDPFLDGRYSAFARVTVGLDVLDRLGSQAPVAASNGERSRPKESLRIESVRLSPLEPR